MHTRLSKKSINKHTRKTSKRYKTNPASHPASHTASHTASSGGGIFSGLSNFVIHTKRDLSTPLDRYKSNIKSFTKQPKRGLMQITYNRGLPDARTLDTGVNNSDSKPFSDTQTATKPHIVINSDDKFLVVFIEIVTSRDNRLLWACNIYSRTIKQDLLSYIAPTPVTTSNYEYRIYAYPKGHSTLTSTLQTILYQKQQTQKQTGLQADALSKIAKPMNNLKFQSSGLDITRTKEYMTFMEYISKNNMKLITVKKIRIYKDKSSGTAILGRIMA
jgi:hypothetical protein